MWSTNITKRHRPHWYAYFTSLAKASVRSSESAEAKMSIALIVISVLLATVTSFTAADISTQMAEWQWRLGNALIAFVVIQFAIITPIRMWRNATWVVNVEEALRGLWDIHDEGVRLLNAHHTQKEKYPGSLDSPDAKTVWVQQWVEREHEWRTRLNEALRDFSPSEERRLRNVVTVEPIMDGETDYHKIQVNILRKRLDRLGAMLARHHPALLPE